MRSRWRRSCGRGSEPRARNVRAKPGGRRRGSGAVAEAVLSGLVIGFRRAETVHRAGEIWAAVGAVQTVGRCGETVWQDKTPHFFRCNRCTASGCNHIFAIQTTLDRVLTIGDSSLHSTQAGDGGGLSPPLPFSGSGSSEPWTASTYTANG